MNFGVFMGGLVWIRGDQSSRTAFQRLWTGEVVRRQPEVSAANEFADQCMIGRAEKKASSSA
jgi:hypothetical protein